MCHIMLTTWCCLIEEKYIWLQVTIFSVESASEHSVIHFPARKLCAHRVMFINTSSDILASCPLHLFNRHTCFSLCMRSPWTSWTERQKQFCKTCSIMHTHTYTHTHTHTHTCTHAHTHMHMWNVTCPSTFCWTRKTPLSVFLLGLSKA